MERISHFDLVSRLHGDIAGTVYLANDLSEDRTVNLRVVPRSAIPSKQVERRFIQDVLAATSIDHPGVAKVYGVEEADGWILVSYEAVDGETLLQKIGKLSAVEIAGIFRQILEGLEAAHREGVVHGCLAPANVVVDHNGRVKLTSFGVVKLVEASPPVAADPAVVAFLSPELLQGMEIDERADLWSAGVILYQMITGREPFAAKDIPSLVYVILNSDPFRGTVPGALLAEHRPLLGRLLRKNPGERPSSARDVLEHLASPAVGERPAGERLSLGVMYFTHTPAGDGTIHLAAGLTEDLIFRLSSVERLAVTSRHDAVIFRDRDVDPQELGRCMGLDLVLFGAVSAAGDTMRVAVRVVDTASGVDVWNKAIQRPAEEAFSIAPAFARGLVDALHVEPGDGVSRSIDTPLTRDARAYDFHARGREFLTQRGRKNTQAAIRSFEYALACDSNLAVAEEGIAAACSGMYTYYDGADAWLDGVAAAATRALEIDPGLIEARFHLAIVPLHRKDYGKARTALEEVLRIRPDYYEALRWLGILSDMTGRYDAALEYYHKSAEIKPCSVEPWLFINMTHRRRGDLGAAMKAARRFLEVGIKTLHVVPGEPVTLSRFCPIYALFGDKDRARDTLDRILRTGTEDGLVLYNCAATYALLADPENSLSCLRKALSAGYKNVREWIESDPDFDEIRETDGFRDLLSEFDLRHRE